MLSAMICNPTALNISICNAITNPFLVLGDDLLEL